MYFLILLIYHCHSSTFTGNTFTVDSDGQFKDHTIQCNENEDCNIICQNYPNSCQNLSIHCPTTNGNCNVLCIGKSACKNININGQTSNSLIITCEGDNACQMATIDARSTMYFVLQCGINSVNACTSSSLFLPSNSNGQKKATIITGDQCSPGIDNIPMQFYAYSGWNDVNILNSISTCNNEIGIMHCGYLYNNSCSFKSNKYKCEKNNDICNNPRQTEAATLSTLTNRNEVVMNETDNTSTSTLIMLLYGIIGILIVCLCCIGVLLFYYINLTQHNTKNIIQNKLQITNQSPSEIPMHCTNLETIYSTTNSSVNTIQINSPTISNNKLSMKTYKSDSNTENAPQPSSTFTIDTNTIENINLDCNYNKILYQHQQEVPIILYTPTMSKFQNTKQNIQHISIPITDIPFQTSLSSNNDNDYIDQIVYQQPEQHQVLQMMSVMNQSQPPSLSEFIANKNFPIIKPNDIETSVSDYSIINKHKVKPSATESFTISNEHDSKSESDNDNNNNNQLQTPNLWTKTNMLSISNETANQSNNV